VGATLAQGAVAQIRLQVLSPPCVAREENGNIRSGRNGATRVEIRPTVGRMKSLSIDDTEIGYSDRGHGEPVFLVHAGVFSDWFLPLSQGRSLDTFRVVRVRRAGYGARIPSHHLTIADHARHVAALGDHLGLQRIHWVGHSSSCQMGLQLALDRPNLIASLVLLEPAAVGGFFVPASEELARRFVGPAMAQAAAGDIDAAFDTFMRGVCGASYRDVLSARLGSAGLDRAVQESAFFFRDEVPAVVESQFGEAEAKRVRQPILVAEGADSVRLGPLSQQITELARTLLPHAEIVTVEGTNHMMPLQDPDAIGSLIKTFVATRVERA
jgi:pimeloyl-ACP methyl ester carboxylesterase